MGYTNIKGLLTDATKFPAAIEAKLPGGAPTISTMLSDVAGKIPAIPDFPMEIPELPAPPELPEAPAGAAARVAPVTRVAPSPAPVAGRLGEEILS